MGAVLLTSTLATPAAFASPGAATSATPATSARTGVFVTTGAPLHTDDKATPLSAPDGTAQIWLDVESAAAGAAITAVQVRAGLGSWVDTTRAIIPFGSAARVEMAPGIVEARWQVTKSFRADVAVTFAATDGTVLGEQLLRDASFVAGNAPTWVTWAELVTPAPDDATADDSADGSANIAANAAVSGGADAQGSDAQGDAAANSTQSQASLSKTGSNSPIWAWVAGLVAVVGGAAVAGVGMYRRAYRRGDGLNGPTASAPTEGGDQ